MDTENVLLEINNPIATVVLNRPEALNAITPSLNRQLQEILLRVQNDPRVRVVVLTGAGKAFCAGGDVGSLRSLKNSREARSFIEQSGKTAAILYNMTKPVIAMVNGVAAGAGFNMALLADIVFCAKSARFAQSFSKIGLIPDWGGNYLLPRAVGLHKAKELIFTGDLLDAEQALRLGLVNQIVDDAKLTEVTYEFADRIAKSAPQAQRLAKQLLNQSDGLTLKNILKLETDAQTLCLQTEDFQEGISAFFEKRPPKFYGG